MDALGPRPDTPHEREVLRAVTAFIADNGLRDRVAVTTTPGTESHGLIIALSATAPGRSAVTVQVESADELTYRIGKALEGELRHRPGSTTELIDLLAGVFLTDMTEELRYDAAGDTVGAVLSITLGGRRRTLRWSDGFTRWRSRETLTHQGLGGGTSV